MASLQGDYESSSGGVTEGVDDSCAYSSFVVPRGTLGGSDPDRALPSIVS
jgi:hypothetical protein